MNCSIALKERDSVLGILNQCRSSRSFGPNSSVYLHNLYAVIESKESVVKTLLCKVCGCRMSPSRQGVPAELVEKEYRTAAMAEPSRHAKTLGRIAAPSQMR